MRSAHPSTKQIMLTFLGWAIGLVAIFGLIVVASNALFPKTPSNTVPAASETASAAVAPTVAATTAVASPPNTPAASPSPSPTPTPRSTPTPAPTPTPSPSHSSRSTNPPSESRPLSGKVIAIDAGHQARGDSSLEPIGPGASSKKPKVSSGTSGVSTRNPESLINLQVALKLRSVLENMGAKVVMVRTTQDVNVSNSKRASIANNAKADLFIRLHCDGNSNHSLQGLSTLVPASNRWTKPIVAESKRAGTYVHRSVIARTRAKNRGVVTRSDLSGFNWAKVPTILVEMGFLSNATEDKRLGNPAYQQVLADGIATGVYNYLLAD